MSLGEMMGAAGAAYASPSAAGALAPISEFSTGFIAQLKRITAPFEKITSIAEHFVSHIDPALVDDLGRKFRDLNATVGIALKPVVEVAREVVKNLSDYMLPLMRKIQPIIQDIAKTIGDVLNDAIEDTAKFLTDMMPTFDKLKEVVNTIVKVIGDVLTVFMALSRAITEMMSGVFKGLFGEGRSLKDVMADFREAVRNAITSLILFSARMMAAFGFTKGIEAMIKAFGERSGGADKQDSAGLAVGMNPAFKAIGDLAKSVQLEAFRASVSQTGDKKDPAQQSAEFLGDIAKKLQIMLDDIKQGKTDDAINQIRVKIAKVTDWFDRNQQKAERMFEDISGAYSGAVRTADEAFHIALALGKLSPAFRIAYYGAGGA